MQLHHGFQISHPIRVRYGGYIEIDGAAAPRIPNKPPSNESGKPADAFLALAGNYNKKSRRNAPALSIQLLFTNHYSMISVTTPEPTVRPPSLIANLSPSSIAIGVISLIVMTTLSPGMHISVPSGRLRSPVTSVVLK